MLALGRSRWEACWKTTSLERFPFGDFPLQVIVHSACQQLLVEPCKAPMQSQYENFLSCGTACKRSIQVLKYIFKIKTHTHTHTHTMVFLTAENRTEDGEEKGGASCNYHWKMLWFFTQSPRNRRGAGRCSASNRSSILWFCMNTWPVIGLHCLLHIKSRVYINPASNYLLT